MGTVLRVGFAMGGGASLGTFSGAALSQAFKLLLLRGRDRRGRPYERVEADVFSGASAGSMALAVMMRGLAAPDPARAPAAEARLTEEFGAEFTERPEAVRRALVAAQILQDVQEEIWVREISLKKMLARREGALRGGWFGPAAEGEAAAEEEGEPEGEAVAARDGGAEGDRATAAGGASEGDRATAAGGASEGGRATATRGADEGGRATAAGGASEGDRATAAGGASEGGRATATRGASEGEAAAPALPAGAPPRASDDPSGARALEEARRRLRFTAGLVDRGAVDELARRYLGFPGGVVDLSGRQILADRVLFASSLANLTPIVADARREYPTDELGLLGLSDGMTSNVHRELRVFDLHFREVDADRLTDPHAFPRRWCRYHAGPKVADTEGTGRGIGSLFDLKGWAKMAATSVASGAFPLAFEPVPLERRSYEFGETEDHEVSLWPARLRGRDRYVFTYVDGGTFNNEPIREAFRLASFIDAQAPEEDYERLIVFVDPHFVLPDPDLRLPLHGRWFLDAPARLLSSVEGLDLKRKTSLDRLIPLAGSLVSAILNESRVIEADKVFRTRKRFRIRNEIRRELDAALATDPDPSVLVSLARRLSGLLAQDQIGIMIPAGALTLEAELRRVMVEEGASRRPDIAAWVAGFVADPASAPPEERGFWLRMLTFAAVDRVMDLEGKMERSQLVAISPAMNPARPGELEDLPGRLANGFGGFTSELAGEHEVKVARYCAQLFLQAAERIRREPLPPKPDFAPHLEAYLEELKAGLKAFEGRLIHLLADSHVELLGALPAGVLRHFIEGKIARHARPPTPSVTYELRLEVPDMGFEFDGEGIADSDLRPQRLEEGRTLITFATHTDGEPLPWTGPHVVREKAVLKVDRDHRGPLTDKVFCTVALPTRAMLKEAEVVPYPIWVARLDADDEGTRVPPERWTLRDEVVGLEQTILG